MLRAIIDIVHTCPNDAFHRTSASCSSRHAQKIAFQFSPMVHTHEQQLNAYIVYNNITRFFSTHLSSCPIIVIFS